jgi:hypothetical protein
MKLQTMHPLTGMTFYDEHRKCTLSMYINGSINFDRNIETYIKEKMIDKLYSNYPELMQELDSGNWAQHNQKLR